MAVNYFHRSKLRLNFDLLAKVTYVGVPLMYKNTVFSETTIQSERKFHMETPYNKLAKIYTNCSGHRTKIATMHIYGKTL